MYGPVESAKTVVINRPLRMGMGKLERRKKTKSDRFEENRHTERQQRQSPKNDGRASRYGPGKG